MNFLSEDQPVVLRYTRFNTEQEEFFQTTEEALVQAVGYYNSHFGHGLYILALYGGQLRHAFNGIEIGTAAMVCEHPLFDHWLAIARDLDKELPNA